MYTSSSSYHRNRTAQLPPPALFFCNTQISLPPSRQLGPSSLSLLSLVSIARHKNRTLLSYKACLSPFPARLVIRLLNSRGKRLEKMDELVLNRGAELCCGLPWEFRTRRLEAILLFHMEKSSLSFFFVLLSLKNVWLSESCASFPSQNRKRHLLNLDETAPLISLL